MHLINIHGFSGFLDNIITKWPLCELESNLAMILPGNSNVSNIMAVPFSYFSTWVGIWEKGWKAGIIQKQTFERKKWILTRTIWEILKTANNLDKVISFIIYTQITFQIKWDFRAKTVYMIAFIMYTFFNDFIVKLEKSFCVIFIN